MKITRPIKHLVTDGRRHLVCLPYSPKNLHYMAAQIGLGKHWFHRDHYDLPVTRRQEIEQNALLVSPKVIVRLIRAYSTPEIRKMNRLPAVTESENMDMEQQLFLKYTREGKKSVHYCPEWDFMAIHDQSPEFDACLCDLKVK